MYKYLLTPFLLLAMSLSQTKADDCLDCMVVCCATVQLPLGPECDPICNPVCTVACS